MGNADRLPPEDTFPDGFITDTYEICADADGFGEMLPRHSSLGDWNTEYEIHSAAQPGSVLTQYMMLLWSMHEGDFWDWRCDDGV
ncbi:hypothetical protein DNAM5_156 [Haloarcula californiae tailed virus 1]|uniref:Uncharacterized protein n=1 Tax=Haloarcula californiae tailed virus 1 TaxID=1273746 RepID=R4TP51_9CAUD|nr:hypothetical protein M202_gp065 [Haloarcula californiae tailed virus 1]AGM12013.1 hypothetical protein DNAM5_156 [Haloarcula californiae tailed virus 1]